LFFLAKNHNDATDFLPSKDVMTPSENEEEELRREVDRNATEIIYLRETIRRQDRKLKRILSQIPPQGLDKLLLTGGI